MLVIEAGKAISAREVQLLNVSSLMLVTCVFSKPYTLLRELQPLNAALSIVVSEAGRLISSSAVQPLNAVLLIFGRLSGKTTFVSDMHPLKADIPISVTGAGNAICVSAVQPLKALAFISFMPLK